MYWGDATVDGYWDKITARRLSRRRSLALAAGAGAGGLLLAACGGSDSDNGGEGQSGEGIVAQPTDTSSQARRGGVWLDTHNADIQTFDPHTMSIPSTSLGTMTYSRLFRPEVGVLKQPVSGAVQPDAVESYEFSGDKLQLTVKLRRNLKFANIAPVNGRNLDAQDVLFSYERLSSIGTQRSFYIGSLGGPIDSVSAPDNNTVVFKLNKVYAPLLAIFSTGANGNFYLVPREAEDQNKLDLRRTQLGSGPWSLKDYQPSIGYTYVRNDGWYDASKIYLDEVQLPIISEYATGLAQFKAGRIYRAGPPNPSFGIRNEDVLTTKRDNPNLNLYLGQVSSTSGFGFFGWNPALGSKTPFRDQRLRQALSMSWDRDIWIDTFLGTQQMRDQGLPIDVRWNTACNVLWEGWWLDPKSSEFGPNGKFYENNIAEAKKLVSAAGFPNGVDADMQHITSSEYGLDFPKQVETYAAFASEVGIRLKSNVLNFSSDWRGVADGKGDFAGVAFRGAGGNNAPDIAETMVRLLHPTFGGVTYTGFFSDKSSYQQGDPEITALLEKTRTEFDQDKRISLIQDVQRLAAAQQYVLRVPGGTNVLSLAWPAVQNENTFRDEMRFVGQWLDKTKAPFA
jgi:ABC-type transport system substrate-binding protein